MKLVAKTDRTPDLLNALFSLWEASVRATHLFLTEDDIRRLKPLIVPALQGIDTLVVVAAADGKTSGFMGIQNGCLEMLFLHPDIRGRGVGRNLLETAVRDYGVRRLDVNEQNPQALGFYRHLGFEVESRSDTDDYGNPFPILHMRLSNNLKE